jgi:hypothetical protein
MPYIHTQLSVALSPKDREMLKDFFCRGIALLPGKSEEYLMLRFDTEVPMYFAGSSAPAAMVEVSIFGSEIPKEVDDLTHYITESIAGVVDIQSERIYVKYTCTPYWGMGGELF